MDKPLNYLIYGRPVQAGEPAADYATLALTASLDIGDAVAMRQQVPLEPLPVPDARASQAVALMERPEGDYLLARTHNQRQDAGLPVYQFVLIPAEVMAADVDLLSLTSLVAEPIDPSSSVHMVVPPLYLPDPTPPNPARMLNVFRRVLDHHAWSDLRPLLQLLGAALDAPRLLIRGFKGGVDKRLALLQALRQLLPARLRPRLTFTTHSYSLPPDQPRVIFSDAESDHDRHLYVPDEILPEARLMDHAYLQYLAALWDEDPETMVTRLLAMNDLPGDLTADTDDDQEALARLAARDQLNQAVASGEARLNDLVRVLRESGSPEGDMRVRYVRELLHHVLEERTPEAVNVLASELENNQAMDAAVADIFEDAMATQPDAVYVFIRNRLAQGDASEDQELRERWRERLQTAAEASLEVAISDGDTATLTGWLRLISREPLSYGLRDVLRRGLREARPRAAEDAELGRELLVLAVKRVPDLIETLLDDEALVASLPEHIRRALQEHDIAMIELLANDSRELFLLALRRASAAGVVCVSTSSIRVLWQMVDRDAPSVVVADPYKPADVLDSVLERGPGVITEGALEAFFTRLLANRRDDLFKRYAPKIGKALGQVMGEVLIQSNRSQDDALALLSFLANAGVLTPQQLTDAYLALLLNADWQPEAFPLVSQVVRVVNQNPEVDLPTPAMWKILEAAAPQRSEAVVRGVIRRLLDEISDDTLEDQLADNLQRLRRLTAWSENAQRILVTWWRDYLRQQSLAQLQRTERGLAALEGKPGLEDLRQGVQTMIALRRMINGRSLTAFAADIRTTYNTLQALAVFEPGSRQVGAVDLDTVRAELAALDDELSANERHVLATNLKGLAQLVATMAENRTKPSLIRRDGSVERQLLSGEQAPQSAIDLMKWLAGYLDNLSKDNPE